MKQERQRPQQQLTQPQLQVSFVLPQFHNSQQQQFVVSPFQATNPHPVTMNVQAPIPPQALTNILPAPGGPLGPLGPTTLAILRPSTTAAAATDAVTATAAALQVDAKAQAQQGMVRKGFDTSTSSVKVKETPVAPAVSRASLSESSNSLSSTSSLSDTDDPTRTPSDTESEESLETSIAYLKEKQDLLQRFSVELQQDELYKASMVKQDIARKEEEEQESLSSSSFTLSDDEDDHEDTPETQGVSIWVRAKKILRSLSRHRGVLYHPASCSTVTSSTASSSSSSKKRSAAAAISATSSTSGNNKKQKRRVRFGPDVHHHDEDDEDNNEDDDDGFTQDDLERASKCARLIIDRTPAVRLISAKEFAASEGYPWNFKVPTPRPTSTSTLTLIPPTTASPPSSSPTTTTTTTTTAAAELPSVSLPTTTTTNTMTSGGTIKGSSDAYMVSLQTILAETKSMPFQTNSVPFHTAG